MILMGELRTTALDYIHLVNYIFLSASYLTLFKCLTHASFLK